MHPAMHRDCIQQKSIRCFPQMKNDLKILSLLSSYFLIIFDRRGSNCWCRHALNFERDTLCTMPKCQQNASRSALVLDRGTRGSEVLQRRCLNSLCTL